MATLSYETPVQIHSMKMENEDTEAGNTPTVLPAIDESASDGNNSSSNTKGGCDRTTTDSPRLVLPAVKMIPGLRTPATSSTDSLTHLLGHADRTQPTVKSKIKNLRGQVQLAFEELNAITTHDDNLEKQYKETVDENVKLTMSLERARREIRNLRGQLSILQMTQREIREERARRSKSYNQQLEYDKDVESCRNKYEIQPILSAQERSRTVNAQGKYIDHSKTKLEKRHRRNMTYPVENPATPQRKATQETLPPPLSGCNCSTCNAVQSLGALTLSSSGPMCGGHVSRSGQQILRGDRVIVKGEKPGTVKYIGRLEGGFSNDIYVGVQLDAPAGFHDGKFKGRQYFHCEPNHGIFVLPSEVICVVSRKVQKAQKGTRERLLTSGEILNRSRTFHNKSGKARPQDGESGNGRITITPSGQSIINEKVQEMSMAAHLMEEELRRAKNRSPGFVGSSADMSKRIQTLQVKIKKKTVASNANVAIISTPPLPQWQEQSPTEAPASTSPPPRPTSPVAKALDESPTAQPYIPLAPVDKEKLSSQSPVAAMLLEILRERDLGATGFVTIQEFVSCLTSPAMKELIEMTEDEAEELMANLGIQSDAGAGIAYDEILPYVVDAL